MSEGYTKLFSDIVDSSIWSEDAETCKVWVTLLALCDAQGFVRGSVPWLAHKSKVSVNKCQQSLQKFESPDPISRTPDNDGKRIKAVDSGWVILNHHIFRARSGLSNDPRRVYQREWMREKRKNTSVNILSTKSTLSTAASASVPCTPCTEEGVQREIVSLPSNSHFQKFMGKLACLYGRSPNDPLTYFEESALAVVLARPSKEAEFEELKKFKSRDPQYFPQSLRSLLEKWPETLDRARTSNQSTQSTRHRDEPRGRI